MKLTPEQVLTYFIPHGGRLEVTHDFLINIAKLDADIIKVRRSQYTHNKSDNWAFRKVSVGDNSDEFRYDLLCIPEPTRDKYDFPDPLWLAGHFSKQFQNAWLPEGIPSTNVEMQLDLEKGMREGKKRFLGFFFGPTIMGGTSLRLAGQFGVLLFAVKYIVALQKNHGVRKQFFEILQSDVFRHLEFPNQQKTFYGYFLRALEAFETGEISGLVRFVKGRYGLPSNALKINDAVTYLVIHYKSHQNPVTNKDVRIWVNATLLCFPELNGGKIIGQTKIDELIKMNGNVIEIRRGGEDKIRKTFISYLEMCQAENPYDQFQFDEWYVEFSCKSGNKKVSLIMLTLMDSASRKTILRKYVQKLDSLTLKEFIQESIERSGFHIPAEYVCDFSSVNSAKIIEEVFNFFTRKFPGKFFWSPTSCSNRKAILERYFRTVASYLAPLVGWKGFGILSRGDSQPARVLQLYLQDPKYLDDVNELENILENFHNLHNRNGMHSEEESPNQMFERNPRPNRIKLSPEQFAFAFYTMEQRVLSRATVTVESSKFECVDEREIVKSIRYDGDEVHCAHDGKLEPTVVYVFKPGSDELIGKFTLKPSPIPAAKINQTPAHLERLRIEVQKREKLVEVLLKLSADQLITLEAAMKVSPGELVLDLLEGLGPGKSTTVSHINGKRTDKKIEINPFNVPLRKKMQKATGNGNTKGKPVPFRPEDNFKHKHYG